MKGDDDAAVILATTTRHCAAAADAAAAAAAAADVTQVTVLVVQSVSTMVDASSDDGRRRCLCSQFLCAARLGNTGRCRLTPAADTRSLRPLARWSSAALDASEPSSRSVSETCEWTEMPQAAAWRSPVRRRRGPDCQSAGRLGRRFVVVRQAAVVLPGRYWSPRQTTSCESCDCSFVSASLHRCPSPMMKSSRLRHRHRLAAAAGVEHSWAP